MDDLFRSNDCLDHLIEKCTYTNCSYTNCTYNITVNDVQTHCVGLKSDKSDSSLDLMSNGIIHGTQLVYTYLSYYFNAMLFVKSVVMPLKKVVILTVRNIDSLPPVAF